MSIFFDIVSSILKPATDEIGSELAGALSRDLNSTDDEFDTEHKLMFRTQDWKRIWDPFLSWQQESEERPHILQAAQAFSEFEHEQIRSLILDGSILTTGSRDKTDKLEDFGLVRQEFGLFLRMIAFPLGILASFGIPMAFVLFLFLKGDDAANLVVFFTLLSWGLLWLINSVWHYRVTLTKLGRNFVEKELLTALLLFLQQRGEVSISKIDSTTLVLPET